MSWNRNKPVPILIADDNRNFRKHCTEVLRNAGFGAIRYAADGQSLLRTAQQMRPRIIITASRLPALSGLEFTRLVRSGQAGIDPALSIIVMTSTPTTAFLEAARESGVDEMLVCPFAPSALLARIDAVLVRPRRFIRSASYVGPCRRRRMLQDYGGELRRESDAIRVPAAPWEAEANRKLVRQSVAEIVECAAKLAPDDEVQLKILGIVTEKTGRLAEEIEDYLLSGAAQSLKRYIAGMRASHKIDPELIAAHADAMHLLSMLTSAQSNERQRLVDGLAAAVDKRLGGAA